jgi:hypothetical protein
MCTTAAARLATQTAIYVAHFVQANFELHLHDVEK